VATPTSLRRITPLFFRPVFGTLSENDIAESAEAAVNELTRYFGGYELPQTLVETQDYRCETLR
jgi:hypothetical protein